MIQRVDFRNALGDALTISDYRIYQDIMAEPYYSKEKKEKEMSSHRLQGLQCTQLTDIR